MYETYNEIQEAEIGQEQSQKVWWTGYIVFGIVLLISCGWFYMFLQGVGLYHRVGVDEYAIVQDVRGNFTVKEYGQYWRGFSNVWIYPRTIEFRFNDNVTCSDGSTMGIESYALIELPDTEEEILELHKSIRNVNNIKDLISAVVQTSLKHTAPSMTGKQLITSHKAEFADIAGGQIRDGFYEMEYDAETQQTKFIKDELGKYITTKPSMLNMFGLDLKQFSITRVDIPDSLYKQLRYEKHLQLEQMRMEAEAKAARAKRDAEVQRARMLAAEAAIAAIEILPPE